MTMIKRAARKINWHTVAIVGWLIVFAASVASHGTTTTQEHVHGDSYTIEGAIYISYPDYN